MQNIKNEWIKRVSLQKPNFDTKTTPKWSLGGSLGPPQGLKKPGGKKSSLPNAKSKPSKMMFDIKSPSGPPKTPPKSPQEASSRIKHVYNYYK